MKQTIFTKRSPLGDTLSLYKNVWKGPESSQTVSIVAGLQGDRLNGLIAAGRLARFLQSVEEGNKPGYTLTGTVQVFPVVNHRALESGTAHWSYDNLDADLAFPGSEEGDLTEAVCHCLLRETAGSDFGIILQSGTTHFEDAPHVRFYRPDLSMRKAGRAFHLDVVRELPDTPAVTLQLSRQWHNMDIAAFTLSAGRPQVHDADAAQALYRAVVNFLMGMEFLTHPEKTGPATDPLFYKPKNEVWVTTREAGVFLPAVRVGSQVEKDQPMGEVVDLYGGHPLETVHAPSAGYLVSLRAHPLVHEHEPVAVILTGGHSKWFWPF